jgi:hypothetical protein
MNGAGNPPSSRLPKAQTGTALNVNPFRHGAPFMTCACGTSL